MVSLQINKQGSLHELEAYPTTAIRQHVIVNQSIANERSIRQVGQQRNVVALKEGDPVSVAVPALDRASTDDKRVFGRVITVYEELYLYKILTKYGVLDRNYPISVLNPLPPTIDLGIPEPPPTAVITLHYCATQESTTKKVPVHCGCKDQKTWCSTRRCACFKANVKCSIACHGGKDQDNIPDCPNISSMQMRTQKGHRTRDQGDGDDDSGKKRGKRLRKDTAGR